MPVKYGSQMITVVLPIYIAHAKIHLKGGNYAKYNDVFKKMMDVVVVGGGTAGVFAAISAARTGAKTILIEKNSMLGGTITAAAVNFPGLFFAWGNQIIDGPCWEAIERTIELGGARMPKISYQPGNHWEEQILLNRFVYTYVLNEMCRESGGCITPRRCIWALSKCYGRPGDSLVKYTEDRHAYRYEERRYFGRKNGTGISCD